MSKNDDLKQLLRTARRHLDHLEEMIDTSDGPRPRALAARERLTLQAEAVFSRGGGSGGRGGGHSNPTEQAVFDDQRRAESARILSQRDDLDDKVKTAGFRLEEALAQATAALQTKPARKGEPGCRSCERVTRGGKPHPESFQRVFSDGLCKWCYQFVHGAGPSRPGYGVLPVVELVEWHLDHLGSPERMTHVRDLMPDAFRAREQRKRKPGLCHQPTYLNGTEGTCAKPFMHSGQCLPAEELDAVHPEISPGNLSPSSR